MRRFVAAQCLLLAVVATACSQRTPPEPAAPTPAPPTAPRAEPPPPEPPPATATPIVDGKDLDALVRALLIAAERHDADTVARYVADDFTIYMIEDTPSRAELRESWRADPAQLDRLAALLRGRCAFEGTRDHWMCPRALASQEEYGDAERIHLVRTDGTWRWVAFILEEAPPPRTVRKGPPSADPLIDPTP